jgi:hypothetical protein
LKGVERGDFHEGRPSLTSSPSAASRPSLFDPSSRDSDAASRR